MPATRKLTHVRLVVCCINKMVWQTFVIRKEHRAESNYPKSERAACAEFGLYFRYTVGRLSSLIGLIVPLSPLATKVCLRLCLEPPD